MAAKGDFQLSLQKASAVEQPPVQSERPSAPRAPRLIVEPRLIARALRSTAGFAGVDALVPGISKWQLWSQVASFSVCQKTGTAAWLDIWDADHFDGFTNMQRCVSDCRAWFSADGYAFWGAPQTKTGRINCYFRASTAGNYICTAQLQSYNGAAAVECLIDNSTFGLLPFNGTKVQPHPCALTAGYHRFRIRQSSGSFFFVGLTVHRV
jgi:hypothetical protein